MGGVYIKPLPPVIMFVIQKLWSLLEEKHTQPQVGDDQVMATPTSY